MQQDSDIIRFSTEDFPEPDRVAIVREQFGRSFFGIDIEPLPDVGFLSDITIGSLAGASLSLNAGGGGDRQVTLRHRTFWTRGSCR